MYPPRKAVEAKNKFATPLVLVAVAQRRAHPTRLEPTLLACSVCALPLEQKGVELTNTLLPRARYMYHIHVAHHPHGQFGFKVKQRARPHSFLCNS